jgi:hypothetical protein
MDWTEPVAVLLVVLAALWVGWSVLLPKAPRRTAAGWIQRSALRPGRSRGGRARLLWLADRVAPRCCAGKD